MLEYLAILMVFSLILAVILSLVKKYIPLGPRIIYGTVGISFVLGAFFPVTITTLSPAVAIAVYFGLIVIIAAALSYAESRIFLSTSGTTLKDNVLEPENSEEVPVDDYDLSEEETGYPEACAAQEQEISAAVPEEETEDLPINVAANEHNEDQPAPGQENDESNGGITGMTTFPVTINDYISAGFKARTSGDLIGAVKYFMTAFQMNREQHISTTLALEICTVYQELGQYSQAMLILKSVIEQENFISEPDLRQKINDRLIYLEILAGLLRITKMPHAPYSKIPDIIKIKANLEKDKKLMELNQGGAFN